MSNILIIDPGVCDVTRRGVKLRIDGCACAEFVDGLCRAVFFGAYDGPHDCGFDLVVIERPLIRGINTPDPQDIVDLAWDGAMLAASLGAPVKWYFPQTWKGGYPKPVHHRRMWPHLSAAEQRLFPADTPDVIEAAVRKGAADKWSRSGADYYPRKWRTHNLLDALGIGLYELGRFDIRKDTPDDSSFRSAVARRSRASQVPAGIDQPGLVQPGRAPGRDQPRPQARARSRAGSPRAVLQRHPRG